MFRRNYIPIEGRSSSGTSDITVCFIGLDFKVLIGVLYAIYVILWNSHY